MHAAIFGNVAAIIQKLYANRVRYHSRANEIKQFIRVHRIEQDLANRLEDYFHTTWSLSGGVDTSEVRKKSNVKNIKERIRLGSVIDSRVFRDNHFYLTQRINTYIFFLFKSFRSTHTWRWRLSLPHINVVVQFYSGVIFALFQTRNCKLAIPHCSRQKKIKFKPRIKYKFNNFSSSPSVTSVVQYALWCFTLANSY